MPQASRNSQGLGGGFYINRKEGATIVLCSRTPSYELLH